MATLNYNGSASAGTTVEVWSDKAIIDRKEASIFEYLKDYSNAIIRQDDAGLRAKYPSPNLGYTMTYFNEARLIGKGVSNQTGLVGKEEKRVNNSFSYSSGLRRWATANDEYVPNVDISDANYMKKERESLAVWQGEDKQFQDMARMISGAMLKNYGNGAVGSYASITSSHVLDDDTFVLLQKNLLRYNANPVWFSQDSENSAGQFNGYVMLVDETVAQDMLVSTDFSAFIDTYFQGMGYNTPLAKIMYGKKQNMAIIPIAQQLGFGSPLRPEVIVGADASAISNSGNSDVTVGLPQWDGTSAYDDYTNDTSSAIEFTKYLSDFLTASGTTSSGVSARIVKYDGTLVTGITVKLGSTNTDYTINIANASGASYTPEAGDRVIILGSIVMGLGGDAYVSHQSAPYFTGQKEDYDFESGVAVNYWEGGTLIKNSQNISNNVVLDFVYAS